MADHNLIPIICGPTGSGKTSAALRLASQYPLEVVSADSRQIIRHLNIGTAKPTAEEQRVVRFHLIDLIEPGERYSAFRFIENADRAIGDVLARGRIPVVVGGTGLYLRALTEGVVEIEEDRPELRERLENEMNELGPEAMHRRLMAIDPGEAAKIHPNNRVRVVRALEICELAGQPKSKLTASGAYKRSGFDYQLYCLQPERERLYEAINRRVDVMMQAGLLEEVKRLVGRGLGPALRRANVIGYEELLDFLDGRVSLDGGVDLIKQNSRRYAKRQMTWFRHQTECDYFADAEPLLAALRSSLSSFQRSH